MNTTPDTARRSASSADRESWASRFGFIMAAAGFAIGLGNIWRFPYLAGMHGGGAFLAIYLLLALLIGIPLFTAEVSLGRKAQLTPIAGMRKLTGRGGSPWNLFGWLGVVAAFLILSYYLVIMGWVLAYFAMMVSGQFVGISGGAAEAMFSEFVADSGRVLLYTAAVAVMIGLVVARGLRNGIEQISKVLMPLLFVLLIVLAVGALSLPGAMAGLRWYLAPDFSKVDASVVLAALGQVFYSIGVGMAGAFVYGSYLHPTESDVPGGAVRVVGFDIFAAVTAGFVMFPALFAFGLSPDVGPGLLFVTMTNVFAVAPAGQLVGSVFFLLVLIAGLTSGIALVETLTASGMDSLGLQRAHALWGTLALVFVTAVPSALAFGPWAELQFFNLDFFSLMDFISGNVLLPLGGLLLALYTAFAWGFDRFSTDTNRGAGRLAVTREWKLLINFVIPVAVAIVLLSSLGLFDQ